MIAAKPVSGKFDRRIVNLDGLGFCLRCRRDMGTMGLWTGAKHPLLVRCDGCALGWPPLVPISEGEARARYGTRFTVRGD